MYNPLSQAIISNNSQKSMPAGLMVPHKGVRVVSMPIMSKPFPCQSLSAKPI